jgi:hypothetical protein
MYTSTPRPSVTICCSAAPLRRQLRRRRPFDEPFPLYAVRDELRDADDLQVVLRRELLELRHSHHRPVRVHELAQRTGGLQARQAAEVRRRLRVAGADEDAAVAYP